MSGSGGSSLTLTEGAVLGLLVRRPRHGFALAREFTPGSRIGRVLTVRRPLVYRALNALEGRGLVVSGEPESTPLGPSRSPKQVTAAGREAFDGWLATPVRHVRDVRLELLLKLALLDDLGRSMRPLLEAQRRALAPVHEALTDSGPAGSGFDALLGIWRTETTSAVMRFLDEAIRRHCDRPSELG
ncbi:PadR family transcriptional regulator [Pseudonocardia hispaniensis]|uniref:PadR family transcriptional regulator n=1 Tax=Pseudonocardia hispaniensis TaxID=904933 RepID=A0ABW1J897_9PSEU